MSGSGLADLEWPRKDYSPHVRARFPRRETCRRYDSNRAEALIAAAKAPSLIGDPAEVRELASRLARAAASQIELKTRASAVYQGELKVKLGGAFAELIDKEQQVGVEVAFVTLCPRGGDWQPVDMDRFDPRQFGRKLDQALTRALDQAVPRGSRKTGWSAFFLEGEYQCADALSRMHWHGWAAGDELLALEALRNTRAYRSANPQRNQARDRVRHRIKRTRKLLYDLPGLCTYPLKDWRARSATTNQRGTTTRAWPIDMPEHVMPIEWLFRDRWSVQDISVLRGLRVVRGRLTKTRR